jgi:hypothetical protein
MGACTAASAQSGVARAMKLKKSRAPAANGRSIRFRVPLERTPPLPRGRVEVRLEWVRMDMKDRPLLTRVLTTARASHTLRRKSPGVHTARVGALTRPQPRRSSEHLSRPEGRRRRASRRDGDALLPGARAACTGAARSTPPSRLVFERPEIAPARWCALGRRRVRSRFRGAHFRDFAIRISYVFIEREILSVIVQAHSTRDVPSGTKACNAFEERVGLRPSSSTFWHGLFSEGVMNQRESFVGIGVLGNNMAAIMQGFGTFSLLASKFLLNESIGQDDGAGNAVFEPNHSYPLRNVLNAFEKIEKEFGEHLLKQVGIFVPKNTPLPPFIKDIDAAFKMLDASYHMNHAKNGVPMFSPDTGQITEGIGHYNITRVANKNQIIIEATAPYPDAFDAGLFTGLAQRYQPTATVVHDATKPCRKKGGSSCTYTVSWK